MAKGRKPKPKADGDLAFFDRDVPPMSAAEAVAFINKRVNEGQAEKRKVIRLASEAANPFLLRRPTGLAGVDIECGGGFPAGGITQLDGPDGCGKDALAGQAVYTCQTIYGKDARVAWCCLEHPLDKEHLRIQGIVVPSSKLDIQFENELRNRRGEKPYTKDQITRKSRKLGEFLVFDDGSHEQRLEAVLELVAQNYCQIIVVDSIAAVTTRYRMNTSLDKEPKQAATAFMLSEFMKKAYPYFTSPKRGTLNLTTLVMTNQVRAKRAMGKGKRVGKAWEDASPRAIRHGKLLDITLSPGDWIKEGSKQVGKGARWRVTKGKAGCHEGGSGELRYLFANGFDMAADLFVTAGRLGLIVHESKAKTSTLIDENGEVLLSDGPWGPFGADLRDLFFCNEDIYWQLYYACLKKAEVSCLHKL